MFHSDLSASSHFNFGSRSTLIKCIKLFCLFFFKSHRMSIWAFYKISKDSYNLIWCKFQIRSHPSSFYLYVLCIIFCWSSARTHLLHNNQFRKKLKDPSCELSSPGTHLCPKPSMRQQNTTYSVSGPKYEPFVIIRSRPYELSSTVRLLAIDLNL